MEGNKCPACGSPLSDGLISWHSICNECEYESAHLLPAINSSEAHEKVDEVERETGLRTVRARNFQTLMNVLKRQKPMGGRLLDVGCAHGWFLDSAAGHFEALGIEPDQAVCAATIERGIPVRMGYFPEVLDDQEKFDVIIFNDVFEHIPNSAAILQTCYERLNEDGLVVLNLPSSNGIFYRASKIFKRLGQNTFFDRLWQKDMPSPHLHYFNRRNLARILKANGFHPIEAGTLPVLSLSGLYTRIAYAGNLNGPAKIAVYGCVAAALPVLKALPSDIMYTVAIKTRS